MIQLAVVGAGHWGPNLINNFSVGGRSRVRFVVDPDEQRLAA
ncbi:MAG TPA: gfo/Idh/MocA family oxidoreductase, partial [Myxococcales bacterium]|nr:gfo/Idh/MocA family oxidoreductase [Myxococcales bacterium]